MSSEKLYYVWSKKHQEGIKMTLWWGKNHSGYTSNLDNAGKYTKEEAIDICKYGDSLACPVEDVDKVAVLCVELYHTKSIVKTRN